MSRSDIPVKSGFHSRNRHRAPYDFAHLVKKNAKLQPFVAENKYGNLSINFFDPKAVKMLNTILIQDFYGIDYWDIPDTYLTPAVPGRAEYIHRVSDLLSSADSPQKTITCLDVGTGANLIYPIIGTFEYNWKFIATDIDEIALGNAALIISKNTRLQNNIDLRQQTKTACIFEGVIRPDDELGLTLCNPPFYKSRSEAIAATRRKVSNLTGRRHRTPIKNFGGVSNELWHEKGESGFIAQMIKESPQYKSQVQWFTSLVSKESTLKHILKTLKKIKPSEQKIIPMTQGNKTSRILAWTFQ